MSVYHYSNCLKIVNKVIGGGGQAKQALDRSTWKMADKKTDDWDIFRDATLNALRSLNDLPSGRKMIEEINASGHPVEIGEPSVDRLDIPRGEQLTNSCYSAEHKAQFYKSLKPDRLGSAARQAAALLKAFTKVESAQKELFQKLRRLIENSCGQLVWEGGTSPWDNDWRVASVAINSSSESFLKYTLEAFLTPGGGLPATIRWHPASTQFATSMADKAAAKQAAGQSMGAGFFKDRPDFIALGHELVHAWRAVTGRAIFNSQDHLHDEHMTVGLTPRLVTPEKQYTGMQPAAASGLLGMLRRNAISNRITENQIRTDAKVALRPLY